MMAIAVVWSWSDSLAGYHDPVQLTSRGYEMSSNQMVRFDLEEEDGTKDVMRDSRVYVERQIA